MGLPSLPDDIICEIFSLLDTEALKSCSLAGKALSCAAKPFIHRTLYLTPRSRAPRGSNVPGLWNELKGLQVLGERGLLQHTRRVSISLSYNSTLFAHDLQPHIQHLHTLTNLSSLQIYCLDTPSFFQKVEEYFGSFFGTLQSLELISPRGYHKQILYFICQFPNLRDLRIKGVQGYTSSTYNGDPRLNIKTSPPLDGTLDIQLKTGLVSTRSDSLDSQLIVTNLTSLPSGLKFWILKLSGCGGNDPQLLVDACAQTLECMEFTGKWFGPPPCPRLSFARHPGFRKFEIKLLNHVSAESSTGWLSETLSTITSEVFAKLIIWIPPRYAASENQVRGWNSVDDVLDRLNPCGDVTLVVRPLQWVVEDKFKDSVAKRFPLMWKSGRVVLEVSRPYT